MITLEKLTELPAFSFRPLYEIMESAEKFRLLTTAIDYDLFEHLKTPKPADALSSELGTDARLTEKLCNVLAAMGLLIKIGSCYCNSPISNTYMIASSPFCQRHLLNLKRESIERKWALFPRALKEGSLKAERRYSEAFTRDFLLAMAEGALRGGLQKVVDVLSSMDDFQKARTLLDLGGGHALYAIAFAQMNPQLEAYVLDFPHVIESVTKHVILEYGMSNRVHTIPADFLKNDLGGKYDVIFASDALYKANPQLSIILQKVASSLNSDGLFISKHWFLNDDKSGPLTAVLFDLNMSIEQYGDIPHDLFTMSEFIRTLNHAGFQLQNVIDVTGQHEPAKLVIAKRCLT